ncbi:type II toxin-antitoxin system PemK/MazF family toxin [Chryseobacterium sp.]|uniref:type II toxin-antitoxin system PemK/MazF family toxin n=1 Tax=Chryseobacterium sp. TaxID=1871047 RepID=UPI000EE64AE6|nr:type II toxin-antitoxin system PemK/MazF family toxin [Chryseobacterium sp.]HCA07457.1 hypothetical protein [Chryseobacterium sp.]
MSVKRGQIIFHNFPLPGLTDSATHPILIISNQTVSTECGMYVGLMITSSENFNDYFTFELKDKMFSQKDLDKNHNYLRLHLIAYFAASTIYNPKIVGEIKPEYIEEILEEQRVKVFDED